MTQNDSKPDNTEVWLVNSNPKEFREAVLTSVLRKQKDYCKWCGRKILPDFETIEGCHDFCYKIKKDLR